MRAAFCAPALALFALALAGCGPTPLPAHPALWRVDGPHGQRGWLFGTIHMLPGPVAWRTPTISTALAASDALIVEIATLIDDQASAQIFDRLAHGAPQPPLAAKLRPDLRLRLDALLHRGGLRPDAFADVKTWAAALMLAQVAESGSNQPNEAKWGIDRALLRDRGDEPVAELEGTARQLALFDTLPEAEQRALLADVVASADSAASDARRLSESWRTGDMAAIARETQRGMLADAKLRQVLYVARNQAWSVAIASVLAQNRHPFVAVGAAHMAGDDGLPTLLAARGFTVTRIE